MKYSRHACASVDADKVPRKKTNWGSIFAFWDCFSPLQNFLMWEIGETCDNRGPALPPAPDFGSRLKPNILLLWRPNSRRRRRRRRRRGRRGRRRRGDPTSPPLETPSCCCGTRSQPPPVSNHVGPGQSGLVLHQSLESIFLPLWSFCNSTRTFCNHICTFDVGVQGKVPIEPWLFTREPKDGSSLFLFLIITWDQNMHQEKKNYLW